jgi:hypothetical protein
LNKKEGLSDEQRELVGKLVEEEIVRRLAELKRRIKILES